MTQDLGKLAGMALVALALTVATGCSADTDKAPAAAATSAATGNGASGQAVAGKDGKAVEAAILDHILPGLEGAFKSRNAKARWEGTALHIKMDGDITAPIAGWTDCRVITTFLKDGQTGVLEFPNGTLQCSDVLKGQ